MRTDGLHTLELLLRRFVTSLTAAGTGLLDQRCPSAQCVLAGLAVAQAACAVCLELAIQHAVDAAQVVSAHFIDGAAGTTVSEAMTAMTMGGRGKEPELAVAAEPRKGLATEHKLYQRHGNSSMTSISCPLRTSKLRARFCRLRMWYNVPQRAWCQNYQAAGSLLACWLAWAPRPEMNDIVNC